MDKYKELYDIIRKEVKPALGCTGPIGSALVAAHAYEAIGGEIKRIYVEGGNPKSDDVAYPGTRMLGEEMAYALGAVCGDASAGLEVLHAVTPEGELKARKVAELVEIDPEKSCSGAKFFRKVTVETDKGKGVAIIENSPDGLVYKARNDEVLLDVEPDPNNVAGNTPLMKYKVKDLYEFASEYPIEEFDFLLETAEMNMAMVDYNLSHPEVGIRIGQGLYEVDNPSPITRAKAAAACACEGRMSGVELPIMSVAGKGNVGVASTLPIVSQARDYELGNERMQRAMALSILTATAVIHRIGKAPTMCSCEVAASMGVTAGTVLLKGGTEEQVEIAIQNLIPNVFGVVCDGAKIACALRMASSTGIAIDAANLALKGIRLPNNQGVLDISADASIDFLGDFALTAMNESDDALNRKLSQKRKIFPLMTFEDRQKQ